MTVSLVWREVRGMEVLHLGEIEVGRVCRDGGKKNRPRWLFVLDINRAFWRDEKTIEQAKFAVEARIMGWLARAGLA